MFLNWEVKQPAHDPIKIRYGISFCTNGELYTVVITRWVAGTGYGIHLNEIPKCTSHEATQVSVRLDKRTAAKLKFASTKQKDWYSLPADVTEFIRATISKDRAFLKEKNLD